MKDLGNDIPMELGVQQLQGNNICVYGFTLQGNTYICEIMGEK